MLGLRRASGSTHTNHLLFIKEQAATGFLCWIPGTAGRRIIGGFDWVSTPDKTPTYEGLLIPCTVQDLLTGLSTAAAHKPLETLRF